MKGLDQDIKTGRFSRAYLLYGDEEYLRLLYCRRLSAAICDPSDTMNYTYYEGSNIDPEQVIDMARTLPFFKERRLIVISNSSFFHKSCDILADYMANPDDTTCFIFVEEKVDKRSRMYKALAKTGRCVEMSTPGEKELTQWAAGILARSGRAVRAGTLLRMFDRCGTNMGILKNELDKLISYTEGRGTIEDEDIDAVCTVELRNSIFDMIDAVTDRKTEKAFSLYYELLSLKVSPYTILPAMFRQFNLLLNVKEAMETTSDVKQIAGKVSLMPYVAGKYVRRCSAYSSAYLRTVMERCLSLEQEAKSGRISDRLSVELLLFSVSRSKRR